MLDALPDAALHNVLAFLSLRDLGFARCTCTALRTAGEVDDIWRNLFSFCYPVDVVAAEVLGSMAEPPPWHCRLRNWAALQGRWRGARSGCRQTISTLSASHSLFCMNSLGDGRFICSGSEGVVRVLAPTAGGGVRVTSEWDTGSAGHLGMSVDIAAQTVVTCG